MRTRRRFETDPGVDRTSGQDRRHRRRHQEDRERGAVFAEFTLVLPFFMFLIFLLINFGVMFSFRQEISQAAGEGARAAAVQPVGTSDSVRVGKAYAAITAAMQAQGGMQCVGGSLTKGGTTVGSCSADVAACPEDASLKCVTVTVVHQYRAHPVVQVPSFFGFTNPETLRYSATARVS